MRAGEDDAPAAVEHWCPLARGSTRPDQESASGDSGGGSQAIGGPGTAADRGPVQSPQPTPSFLMQLAEKCCLSPLTHPDLKCLLGARGEEKPSLGR